MIEPTESEDLAELDRFCDAMICAPEMLFSYNDVCAPEIISRRSRLIQCISRRGWLMGGGRSSR